MGSEISMKDFWLLKYQEWKYLRDKGFFKLSICYQLKNLRKWLIQTFKDNFKKFKNIYFHFSFQSISEKIAVRGPDFPTAIHLLEKGHNELTFIV